ARIMVSGQVLKRLVMCQIRSFGGVEFTDPSPDPRIRSDSGT
ncbi:hypothetical protein AVEN_112527-1, partial [Araneus ventricosus]